MKLKLTPLGPLVLLMALLVPHASAQVCVPPPPGLISWWTADGTTLDFLGNNDGVAVPSVSYTTGEVDDAFSFSGTQYVQVQQSSTLEPSQITVDAWVQAVAPGASQYVVSKGALENNAASYALYTGASGGLQFYVYDGTKVNLSPDPGSTAVWDGKWHHVAGTYDGSAVRLFLDGSEVGSGTAASTAIAYGLTGSGSVTNDLFIGDYNPTCSSCSEHHFTGQVDEVEIFQGALPLTNIKSIFLAGPAGKCLPVQIKVGHTLFDLLELLFAGRLRIAILGSPAFDTGHILKSTLLLAPSGDGHNRNAKVLCNSRDVNGDTIADLVCSFPVDLRRLFDDDLTVVVDGQVTVPGGQRTFFGTASLER